MPFKRNVFLLGAGASADAGAPLMWNFLDVARSLLRDPHSGLDADERKRFESVFDYQFQLRRAQALVELDLDNVEDLFGVIDFEDRVERKGAREARENLVFLIVRTLDLTVRPRLSHTIPFDARPPGREMTFHAWHRFAEIVARLPISNKPSRAPRAEGAPDSIITFNYDLLVDAALRDVGVLPDYCLPDAVDRRTDRARTLRLRLLKLHGSAGWTHCPRCPPNDDHVHVFDNLAVTKTAVCQKNNEGPMTPMIVPPTWDKGASRSHLAPVWKAAWEELQTAQRLFIIGYSAPASDRYIRYFLASALANNEDLSEIIVVTDDARRANTERTYRELFRGAAAEHRVAFPGTEGFQQFVAMGHLLAYVEGRGHLSVPRIPK